MPLINLQANSWMDFSQNCHIQPCMSAINNTLETLSGRKDIRFILVLPPDAGHVISKQRPQNNACDLLLKLF